MTAKMGFAPVYDENSKVLILGSFPSVKSRQVEFYYGNKQNRFWKMLCGYFGVAIPEKTADKKRLLLDKGVALWDVITECEIEGSADASVKNPVIIDLAPIVTTANLRKILLNGTLAYDLFKKAYPNCSISLQKMPSTSPANPRYDESIWRQALDDVFTISN